MDGEPREGTYKDGMGGWVRVEYRYHPTKRLVARPLRWSGQNFVYADNTTPDLTPALWASFQSWL